MKTESEILVEIERLKAGMDLVMKMNQGITKSLECLREQTSDLTELAKELFIRVQALEKGEKKYESIIRNGES